MRQQLILLLCFTAFCCTVTSPAWAWDSTTAANVLIFHGDGELSASYHMNDWTNTVTEDKIIYSQWERGSSPDIVQYMSSFSLNSGDIALPNILNGASTPPSSDVPPVSLYTFDQAIFTSLTPSSPGLSVNLPSGVYTKTLAIQFTTVLWDGAPAGISLIQIYDENSADWQDFNSPHTLYLSQSADLRVRARYNVGTVSSYSLERTISYTITHPDDWNRDSDNDGFPDVWEIAHGFDPLQQMSAMDRSLDSDGDGIADIDELLRDADPLNPDSPKDSDGDGWSNWDEDIRGTDMYLDSSKPVATRLYEVEVLLSGSFTGGSNTWANAPYLVTTFQGRQLAAGICKMSGRYGVLRVPMGESAFIRGQSPGIDPAKVIAGRYLSAIADPLPADVGDNWQTWQEWQALFTQYLREHLVQTKSSFDVTPVHYAELALTARALELESPIVPDTWFSFGIPGHFPSPAAITALQKRLQQNGRNMNDFINDLTALLDSGCNTIRSDISHFGDVVPAEGMERAAALYAHNDTVSYLAALLSDVSFSQLNSQTWQLCDILDPGNDLDNDSISAFLETSLQRTCSDPFKEDSDSDGLKDNVDNCPCIANPDQRDYDGDDVGDLCDPDDDNDGLSDGVEKAFGSNPFNGNTDGDETSDSDEWTQSTHPGISVYAIHYNSPGNQTTQTVSGFRQPGSLVTIESGGIPVTSAVTYPSTDSWECIISDLNSDGSYDFTLTATLDGYEGFGYFTLMVDLTAPLVSILSPINGSVAPTDIPVLNYTVNEGTAEVWLDGTLVTVVSGENLPRLDLGNHTVRVEALDDVGNSGFEEVTFSVELSSLDRHIAVSSSAINFGAIAKNLSVDKSITVNNQGQTPVTLGTVTDGNALTAPFSISQENCSNRTLAFAETCSITINLVLTEDGTFTDSFAVPNDDPDRNPLTITVSASSSNPFPWLMFLPAILGNDD